MELEITPQPFYIGGVNVGQSVVVAWFVTALLIILAIVVKIRSRNFTEVPKGLQNLPHSFGKECIRKGFQNEGQPECTEKKLAVELHALLAARGGRNEVPL